MKTNKFFLKNILMFAALLLMIVIFSQGAAAKARDKVIGKVTVIAKQVNIKYLRNGKEAIVTVKRGTTLNVYRIQGKWYAVLPYKGWIRKDHVRYEPIGRKKGQLLDDKFDEVERSLLGAGSRERYFIGNKFDTGTFNAAIKLAGTRQAGTHVRNLLPGTDISADSELFWFLLDCAGSFVKDDEGKRSKNMSPNAFSKAVQTVTSTLLEKAKELTGSGDYLLVCRVLIKSSPGFIQQRGRFNRNAFLASFRNLDTALVKRTSKLLDVSTEEALGWLLTVSAFYVDSSGKFDSPGFRRRYAAIIKDQITGEKSKKLETFYFLMKQ